MLPFIVTNLPCKIKKESENIERSGGSFYSFYWIRLVYKPFNISHFYDRIFIELVVNSVEETIPLGIPVFYDRSKDELDELSNEKLTKTRLTSKF